jgi:hypothetical protein
MEASGMNLKYKPGFGQFRDPSEGSPAAAARARAARARINVASNHHWRMELMDRNPWPTSATSRSPAGGRGVVELAFRWNAGAARPGGACRKPDNEPGARRAPRPAAETHGQRHLKSYIENTVPRPPSLSIQFTPSTIQAWKRSEGGVRIQIENCVQDWMLMGIVSKPENAEKARAILGEFGRQRHVSRRFY